VAAQPQRTKEERKQGKTSKINNTDIITIRKTVNGEDQKKVQQREKKNGEGRRTRQTRKNVQHAYRYKGKATYRPARVAQNATCELGNAAQDMKAPLKDMSGSREHNKLEPGHSTRGPQNPLKRLSGGGSTRGTCTKRGLVGGSHRL